MPLLLDTGIVYALADIDDDWHAAARALVREHREPLLTPVTVLPEVTYLLSTRLGPEAERRFVESVAAGELDVEAIQAADLARCAELLTRYPAIGFVDASLVAVAERLRLTVIATTDRRHFSMVRPRHCARFDLVPPPPRRRG